MLQPPGLLEINRNGAFFWMVCWHNHEIAKMKSTILRKKKKKSSIDLESVWQILFLPTYFTI